MSVQIDVNAAIGRYPFRDLGAWEPGDIVRAMTHAGTDEAWISDLSAVFWKDPMAGNAGLYTAHERFSQLRPVPAIHPGLPGWFDELNVARARNVPAVRCDPTFYGISPTSAEMHWLVTACAEADLPLMLSIRLEDIRQRHPNDQAANIPASAIRQLIRSHEQARLIILNADRDVVEQVHFGATPSEATRILWDISWIWGPPEDHLELLIRTVGLERFAFGTGLPLRIPEASLAKVDLLNLQHDQRRKLMAGNAAAFAAPRTSGT